LHSQTPQIFVKMKKVTLDEKATELNFRLKPKEKGSAFFYDVKTSQWHEEIVKYQIAVAPFAEGGIRAAYHAIVHFEKTTRHKTGGSYQCVMKIAKTKQDEQIYFMDVAMQQYAQWWAEQYNLKNPPKQVKFSDAFVVKSADSTLTYGAEDYIQGEYIKHSDNNGWVASNTGGQIPMRNTPHAFSHFTYEASNHRFVIVDIQGVGDYYTDPQIHTADKKGFGLGNLGQDGINKFLATHQCNALCKYFSLPPVGKTPPQSPQLSQAPPNNLPPVSNHQNPAVYHGPVPSPQFYPMYTSQPVGQPAQYVSVVPTGQPIQYVQPQYTQPPQYIQPAPQTGQPLQYTQPPPYTQPPQYVGQPVQYTPPPYTQPPQYVGQPPQYAQPPQYTQPPQYVGQPPQYTQPPQK
jgi:hypothetical protein